MIPHNWLVMARAYFCGRNAPWSFLLADNDARPASPAALFPANDLEPNGAA
jgi:hypothetical protein